MNTDKWCHRKIYYTGQNEYYLFTWSVPEVSMITNMDMSAMSYKMKNEYFFKAFLFYDKDKFTFRIKSNCNRLKCFVSIIIGSKTLLLSKSSNESTCIGNFHSYDLVTLSSEDEEYQKLQQNPNNTLDFICKIIYRRGHVTTAMMYLVVEDGISPPDSLYNLKSLAAVLRNSSESFLKEKVLLQVGEETQTVSKAVLCSRSSVFTKMFENCMKERQSNVVNITDIKMFVLKVLISFLYTGKLPVIDFDFDLLCDLYYAADKYDVTELRQICAHLLILQISMENIHRVMKLAFAHDDELLKSTVLALIATNIETWFSTNDWTNLVNDEPKIAAEVLNFFDF